MNNYLEAEAPQSQINFDALHYLRITDWYVTRSFETGMAIPEEVLTERQLARDAIVSYPILGDNGEVIG